MEELPLLIECARDGDVEAYGRVVRRFQDMAVGYMTTHCWGISTWPRTPRTEERAALAQGGQVVESIKLLMKDLYHLPQRLDEPLSSYAYAVHASIEDEAVREATPLDWW